MIRTTNPSAQIPAVQGQFGNRLATYTTQIAPAALETVLGHDPRSMHWKQLPGDLEHLYSHLQRTTTPKRLESLMKYIRERFIDRHIIAGAFPAVSIAVQNPTQFKEIEEEQGIGVLHFDLSRRNRRVVVDGLARVSAAMQLVEDSENAGLFRQEQREHLQALLNSFTLPCVLYMPHPNGNPLTLEEMQQLFHDFNYRTQPVPPRIAIALDHSDPYISLTNRLGEANVIERHGGMEKKRASLGSKSTAIVVQQNLLRFVRAATEGETLLENKNANAPDNPSLTVDNIDGYEEALRHFLDAFAEGMGPEKFEDRESLHLTAPGWGALGVLYHDLAVKAEVADVPRAARAAAQKVNWHRSAPEWQDIVREKKDSKGNTYLGLAGGGAQTRRHITRTLRDKLGIREKIEQRRPESSGDALEEVLC
ncbi:DNA sulfur modification protein DndB [Ferruginivarius sediminum]|uniref:Uncharacterized protein n=1 Tax=Ferruginivarius sediminum TaxID=2661937 RepID=A0A369T461_9PROT|nr:DNA sulfur modification protein DndB [Ferruginivarius sediminum]RDD60123.1 hypothetical protein DRB17_19730 [Ferruginivarius sediminum]